RIARRSRPGSCRSAARTRACGPPPEAEPSEPARQAWRTMGFLALLIALVTSPVWAAVHYIGPFKTCAGGACPAAVDARTCGPEHPCAPLAYYVSRSGRNYPAAAGDTVRITGDQSRCGTMCDANCIPGKSGVTWAGRKPDDTPP